MCVALPTWVFKEKQILSLFRIGPSPLQTFLLSPQRRSWIALTGEQCRTSGIGRRRASTIISCRPCRKSSSSCGPSNLRRGLSLFVIRFPRWKLCGRKHRRRRKHIGSRCRFQSRCRYRPDCCGGCDGCCGACDGCCGACVGRMGACTADAREVRYR